MLRGFSNFRQTTYPNKKGGYTVKKNKLTGNLTLLTIGIVAVFLFMGSWAEAAEKKGEPLHYKFSTFVGSGHCSFEASQLLVKRLSEVSDGEVIVDYYGAQALGKAKEHYDIVKEGLADIGVICQAYTPSRFPVSTMTTLPFFSKSGITATHVLEELYKRGVASPEYKEVHVLNVYATPPSQMFSGKKLETVEDFAGKRVVGNSPAFMKMWKTLGAGSVPMGYPDIYMALQRGTLDMAPTNWAASKSWKWSEVIDYPVEISICGGFAVATIMNKDSWNRLSPKTQRAWKKVLEEELYLSGPQSFVDADGIGKQSWIDAGKKISVFPADERARLAKKLLPVWEYFIADGEKKGYPAKEAYKVYVDVMKENGETVVIKIPGLYEE